MDSAFHKQIEALVDQYGCASGLPIASDNGYSVIKINKRSKKITWVLLVLTFITFFMFTNHFKMLYKSIIAIFEIESNAGSLSSSTRFV